MQKDLYGSPLCPHSPYPAIAKANAHPPPCQTWCTPPSLSLSFSLSLPSPSSTLSICIIPKKSYKARRPPLPLSPSPTLLSLCAKLDAHVSQFCLFTSPCLVRHSGCLVPQDGAQPLGQHLVVQLLQLLPLGVLLVLQRRFGGSWKAALGWRRPQLCHHSLCAVPPHIPKLHGIVLSFRWVMGQFHLDEACSNERLVLLSGSEERIP